MTGVYFVDRCMGGRLVPGAIRGAGRLVHACDSLFAPTTPDVDWLERAGAERWLVLTADKRIGRNDLEREAIRLAGARVFLFTLKNLRGTEIVQLVIRALPHIEQFADDHSAPFIARVERGGLVKPRELWTPP